MRLRNTDLKRFRVNAEIIGLVAVLQGYQC
jgi:hypothetical protein